MIKGDQKMEQYLNTSDVARITGYTKRVIQLFAKTGKIKAYRRAKNSDYRFLFLDVQNFIQAKKQGPEKKRPVKRKGN